MHEQAYNPPRDPGQAGEQSSPGELDRLTAELSKWQERVPKLSGALRDRTERVKFLERKLEELSEADPSSKSDAGIKARDELIEELESKTQELNALYQAARGKLHSGSLEIDELHTEVQSWKEKWQSLTQTLDDQATVVADQKSDLEKKVVEIDSLESKLMAHAEKLEDATHQIESLSEESESLNRRNENLFETTELANRQIATLGDNLGTLRTELREKNNATASAEVEFEQLKGNLDAEFQKSLGKDKDIDDLLARVESKQAEINALNEKVVDHDVALSEQSRLQQSMDRQHESLEQQLGDIDALTKTVAKLSEFERSCVELEKLVETHSEEADELKSVVAERDERITTLLADSGEVSDEVVRLQKCVDAAEVATGRYDKERLELTKQTSEKEERIQQLQSQLGERSSLVLGLEAEKIEVEETARQQGLDKAQLSEDLAKAERHAEEYGDHVSQLDDKMHRQQELMVSLEEELAQVQQTITTQEKAHGKALTEKDQQIILLQEEKEAVDQEDALVEERMEELEGNLANELAESEKLIATGRDEFEKLQSSVSEREAEFEQLRETLQNAQEQHLAELEKLQAGLKSAEIVRETLSSDADRFERGLAQAIAASKNVEKDRDDFAGQVDLLESELREQKRETAKAHQTLKSTNKVLRKTPSSEAAAEETESLQSEVQKLEQLVRDRTEQLNQMQWRQDMADQESAGSSIDSKMMLVLNQQLTDARASNEQLLKQIREQEKHGTGAVASSVIESGGGIETQSDDLTQIRGVGPKLAASLNALGVFRYEQIAGLDESQLLDESHVLHVHKGRIVRENWIQQAAELAR